MRELWVEKYRPKTIKEYVFKDKVQKQKVQDWVDAKSIQHLLFSGVAGTGKTTLAKVLLHELGVDRADVLVINGSSENGVDEIRTRITAFATTMPFGDFKYVLLDEADYLTPNAQAALRNVMERYSNSCRFLLTCNYPEKIIPALHSRCQGFHIDKLDKEEFMFRVVTILATEGIEVDEETIELYITATYPDMRKCIGLCQQNSQSGTLLAPQVEELGIADYQVQMIKLFSEGKIKEARSVICKSAVVEDYEKIYRVMYENLEYWGSDTETQSKAIVHIRDALVNHTLIADPEINLSACLCELEMLKML